MKPTITDKASLGGLPMYSQRVQASSSFAFISLLKLPLLHIVLLYSTGASLVAQRLKCLPGMQETRVRSLDREDPLEKEMATQCKGVFFSRYSSNGWEYSNGQNEVLALCRRKYDSKLSRYIGYVR